MGEYSRHFEEANLGSYISARNRKNADSLRSPDPLECLERREPSHMGYIRPALLSRGSDRIRPRTIQADALANCCSEHDGLESSYYPSENRRIREGSSSPTAIHNSTSGSRYRGVDDIPMSKDARSSANEEECSGYCLDTERKSFEDAVERYTQARIYDAFENFNFLQEKKSCQAEPCGYVTSERRTPELVTPQLVSLTRDEMLFRDSHGDENQSARTLTSALDSANLLDSDISEELYDKLHAVPGERYNYIPQIRYRPVDYGPYVATDTSDSTSVCPSYISLCSNNRFFSSQTDSEVEPKSSSPVFTEDVGDVCEEEEDDDEDDEDDEDGEDGEEEEDDEEDEVLEVRQC